MTNAQGPTNTRGLPRRRATARVFPGAPRAAAGCFCRHRLRGYRSWDVFWAARAAPKPHTGKQRQGYSDQTSERRRDLVGARVVCEAKRDEKLGLRRPCNLLRRPADGLLCGWGCRTSRCGCSGGPVSREWWISSVKQSTTRLKLAWLASVSGTCHVDLDKLPKFE